MSFKDNFQTKMYAGMALAFAIMIFPIAIAVLSMREVTKDHNELVGVYSQDLIKVEGLRHLQMVQFAAMPAFVSSGDPKLAEIASVAHEKFQLSVQDLVANSQDLESLKLLQQVGTSEQQLHLSSLPALELRKQGASIKKVYAVIEKSLGLSKALDLSMDRLLEHKTARFDQAKDDSQRTIHFVSRSLIMTACLAIALAILVAALMGKLILAKRRSDKQRELLYVQERALSQARKEAVETVAHDLKNPLSAIHMSMELMQERLRDLSDPSIHTITDVAVRSVNRMTGLINTLLDNARIGSQAGILEKKPCLLSLIVKEHLEEMDMLMKQRQISLDFDDDGGTGLVDVDKVRIGQVVSNLVGNAIKFSPFGGRIKVITKKVPKGVVFTVKDSGPGMTKDAQEHVFERFWQESSTAHLGSGLGLAIVKEIVEAHEGKIWVESQVAQGASFGFFLPQTEQSSYS